MLGIVSYMFLVAPARVAASKISEGTDFGKTGGVTDQTVDTVVPSLVSTMMWVVGVLSVIIIIIAGISYATASGDEAKTKKARTAILGGLIGLAVAVLAFTITSFVSSQFH